MLALAAGPMGVWHPGQEIELPTEEAMALITAHYAVLVGGNDGRHTATIGGAIVETAMLAPAEPVALPIETRAPVKVSDPVLAFGKHKGETMSAIYAKDPGYVRSFLSHNDDPEIAAAAKAIAG
jgi:hypothetical protein